MKLRPFLTMDLGKVRNQLHTPATLLSTREPYTGGQVSSRTGIAAPRTGPFGREPNHTRSVCSSPLTDSDISAHI